MWQNVMAGRGDDCKAFLYLPHGGSFWLVWWWIPLQTWHDKISMIPWLVCNVQVVVAMVTRSVISSSKQFSAVQHVEMVTILFFCYNMLRLSPQCLHFINTIGQGNFERIKFSWLIATVILNKIHLGGFGGSLLSDNVMNLRKIAITAAGVLTGDRKLYQKARSLQNCIDIKSELKLAPSVS